MAQASARRTVEAIERQARERTEPRLPLDGLPQPLSEAERDGSYQAQLIRELAVRHITDWADVELEGGPAPPTPPNIAAAIDLSGRRALPPGVHAPPSAAERGKTPSGPLPLALPAGRRAYSSDNQRDASIEDQIEVCRRYAAQRGWAVVEIYADRARSGASRFRSAFQQMQVDAEARRFDLILAEALDRLGRKLADVADLHDRLSFLRIALHTVATGEVTAMHVGMLGTMAQMYLKDLAEKTRRGQLGRALKGRIPGGRAYGYEVLPAGPDGAGERRIKPAEAAVVRRIFELFAAGTSPRAIARQLNERGLPGPDSRPWGDTTIRGQVDRGTGILNNALYVGRLEWNRCSWAPRRMPRLA